MEKGKIEKNEDAYAMVQRHIYRVKEKELIGFIPVTYSFIVRSTNTYKIIYNHPERYATQSRATEAFKKSEWAKKVVWFDYGGVNDFNGRETGECNNPHFEEKD